MSLGVMHSMKETLLKTIEEAEVKMVSNKNRTQRIGGKMPLYLSKAEKEQLVKLVKNNQDMQLKHLAQAILEDMYLPEKAVYSFVDRSEEAEANMVSDKNRRQKIVGGPGIIYYLSEDKKEQLVKLVDDNQDKQPKDFVPAIAKEMDLPEKTVYNFVLNSRRRRSVKQIVDNEKDTCKNE